MCKKAILFVNVIKKNTVSAADEIKTELEKLRADVTVFSIKDKSKSLSEDGSPLPKDKWDIAFSLGGDGTVLYTARSVSPLGVPIMPINLGTLGFIAEVNKKDWLDVFLKWEKGEIATTRRCMLEISVERDSKIIKNYFCLNDVVVSYPEIAKLIKLNAHITGAELVSYRCDGLIVATPTGSTAYSMSAGGPILDPEMEAMILNPICPFTLSNRPFVLPARKTLTITVAEEQRSGVVLMVDGQDTFPLECKDKIHIKQASFGAELIFNGRSIYYQALRTKLFWSGDANA
ncbi:NAD(+)/NADH kinase [Treponema sp. R80B11-R83G3]